MGYWNRLGKSLFGIEKLGDSWFFKTWDGSPSWQTPTTQAKKLKAVLENPAALFIFLLLPELYSMGKYKLTDKDEKEIEEHPVLDFLNNPNPMQTGKQFMWDYMFWRKLGTANIMMSSKVLSERNRMYFLSNDCIDWPTYFRDNSKTLFMSDSAIAELKRMQIKYKTAKQEISFPYERLLQFFDISNGITSWFNSPSRVDALYKIVDNSDRLLQSKNINGRFASKFLVSGKVGVEDTSKLPMSGSDKQSAEDSMLDDGKSVHAVKTMVDIKRFVENVGIFKSLDESWMNDAFVIGKMLNIPKNVIEMLGDSTYENQEKARAAIIGYCIQPDAEDFGEGILKYFGIEGLKLTVDFSHLPFVQVYEKEKAETAKTKAEAFLKLVDAGADQQQAADFLGIGDWLTIFKEPNQRAQSTGENKLTKVS